MKEGWEYKKLKEVGLTQTGTTPSKQIKAYYGGDIPFIRPAELNVDQNGGVQYDSELKLTEEGALKSRVIKANSVLMCCIGSVGKTGYTLNNVTCNQQINTLTPYDNYNSRFVYYALISPFFQQEVIKIANSAKATLPIISKGKWEILSIPVPPLSEQQSIVDYLDSAFAKIDAMKANAEKRLNEAKALFQASLKEMLEPKERWEEKKLIKEFSLKSGENLSAKNQVKGPYPVYGGNGITGYHNQYNLSGDQILIGRVGALCGNIHYIKERIWVTDNAFVVNNISSSWNMLFLSYELEYINLNQYASQTAQPVISNKSMKDVSIFQPPLSEQQTIVATLDSLKSKVDLLQANYDKISQECDALKQAILRQVFE